MRQRPMGVEDLEATMAIPCLATLLGMRLWERSGGHCTSLYSCSASSRRL